MTRGDSSESGPKQWYDNTVEPVADGIYRIPLPLPLDGLRAVNCYVVDQGDGLVLIDPGQAGGQTRSTLEAGLSLLGGTFADVRWSLVTHVHRDHYTHAALLHRDYGIPVALGVGERDAVAAVRNSDRFGLDVQLDQLALVGAPELAEQIDTRVNGNGVPADAWTDPVRWLHDGDVLRLGSHSLRVRHTPGHTVGHVTYFDENTGVLFSGDHVLPRITPSIGFEPVVNDQPLDHYLSSLELTLRDPEAILASAHGPVTESARLRSAALLKHHEERLDLTEKALVGEGSPATVAGRLGWTRHERDLAELDPTNRMLAIFETKAHLEVLVKRGRAAVSMRDGVLMFARAEADYQILTMP